MAPGAGARGQSSILSCPRWRWGLVFTAANMRLARSAMLEVLGSEYIKLARIKGLTESLVILKHAFKNAIIPVLTFACINFALIINGVSRG